MTGFAPQGAIHLALALAAGAAFAAPPSVGDARNGAAIYERCVACHALAYDRTGPRHCGLFGRRAGSVAGFAYSDAMKKSKIVWNAASLDRFLADPLKTVPGTAMGYAGVKNQKERTDLIAYLRAADGNEACRKAPR